MTTYNTYQEAKIANNPSAIYKLDNGEFVTGGWIEYRNYGKHTFELCDPADYCMSMLMFYEIGLELIDGDMYQNERGIVCTVGDLGFEEQYCNNLEGHADPSKVYILKSLALKDIPTETPEEKEVMDSIESVGEVEWKNGDECEIEMQEGVRRYLFGCECPNNQQTCIVFTKDGGGHMVMPIERLKKPETPQQRKERERLEVIDEMCWDVHSLKVGQASALYEAGYRKEKSHGTN
ncbi:hypothetical protein NVP1007O_72 [Vibrio phage 1.007.O._10N.261.55.F9]|nr:hypothetical protein NVP1007O_72 [Vibrio phage 1.007.O._10N.261.55.F9]